MSKLRHKESWYSRTKKELEEMDYKEKYEKALEWMKSVYPTMQGSDKEDAEHYFPELKETEDERIRKWIKKEIEDKYVMDGIVNNKLADEAFAWLEKQKEQFKYGRGLYYYDGEKTYYCDPVVKEDPYDSAMTMKQLEKQQEQKDYRKLYEDIAQSEWFKKAYVGKSLGEEQPTNSEIPKKYAEWSEADEVYLEDALWCVKQATKVAKGENDMGACWSAERWLKSLPERFEAKEDKK